MGKIYNDATELIGKTPIVRLGRLERFYEIEAGLFGKLESKNPSGSVKDRAAAAMLSDAKKRGLIGEGSTIIEPTSGNTGIGLAMAASVMGFRVVLTMPETMSAERVALIKAYGAEIVLTDGTLGMGGAIKAARELVDKTPGAFMPDQFKNPANPAAHYETTGPEIWDDMDGIIDAIVCGIGSGGTANGTFNYMKKMDSRITTIAVEPEGSSVLSGGSAGPHGLQGIGAGFVPDFFDRSVTDEIICVSDADAKRACVAAVRKEGLLLGISSGAAICAAVDFARRSDNKKPRIIAVLPDSGERYISTGLFDGET
ncbi:MAG: cysteine synthase A [Defluviitaleaceae bacterium]|nr:cysteine synthase A [Defluviitaleaceae bacterium]